MAIFVVLAPRKRLTSARGLMHPTSAARPRCFNHLPVLLSKLTARSADVIGKSGGSQDAKRNNKATEEKVVQRKFAAKFYHLDLPYGLEDRRRRAIHGYLELTFCW